MVDSIELKGIQRFTISREIETNKNIELLKLNLKIS